ncbi:hypothetical protein IV203_027953 [Nitzschia inconspicua]|uniref:Late endosomal/lysosomal adaptor and MAPK and MTOR activator 4 n=1 Tax=Nitzschia inconspicua TaxID=303405 RepID=A0A9K3LY11_9STRA|nr:hypothetical protein IV203_027953 [Nitzschia inconspicua]
MNDAASSTTNAMMNLELHPVPGQDGYVVLDLRGNLLQSDDKISLNDVTVLYQMLVASASLDRQHIPASSQKRLIVSFDTCNYNVARDANHIYIVKTVKNQ